MFKAIALATPLAYPDGQSTISPGLGLAALQAPRDGSLAVGRLAETHGMTGTDTRSHRVHNT
jgi:hypothetical protein